MDGHARRVDARVRKSAIVIQSARCEPHEFVPWRQLRQRWSIDAIVCEAIGERVDRSIEKDDAHQSCLACLSQLLRHSAGGRCATAEGDDRRPRRLLTIRLDDLRHECGLRAAEVRLSERAQRVSRGRGPESPGERVIQIKKIDTVLRRQCATQRGLATSAQTDQDKISAQRWDSDSGIAERRASQRGAMRRPSRRFRLMILRPFLVLMRARKPMARTFLMRLMRCG